MLSVRVAGRGNHFIERGDSVQDFSQARLTQAEDAFVLGLKCDGSSACFLQNQFRHGFADGHHLKNADSSGEAFVAMGASHGFVNFTSRWQIRIGQTCIPEDLKIHSF